MAHVEAYDPVGSARLYTKDSLTKPPGLISSENLDEMDTVPAKPRAEIMMSSSTSVSDIEKIAEEILEYTGLAGERLKKRMRDFIRLNQGKGLYDEHDIIKKSVSINDPIHKTMKLHPLLEKVMNTPEFYRLKNVKQLGGVCHVYPGANHTRFEHSLGVSYIAGRFISHLRDQHPSESKIEPKDILCVKVAGLCHDLGQGPYSHVFEKMIVNKIIGDEAMPKRWCSKMSVLIFRKILRDRLKVLSSFVRSGLCKTDVQFIEEMIDHDASSNFNPQGRKDEKQRFLYEIVTNRTTEIDVDKWDCFSRDCHYLGITIDFQWQRLMELGYIVGGKGEPNRHIGFRNKEVNDIYEMFHTQWCLTCKAYQHKTVHAIEMMIAEAILLCKDIELIHPWPLRGCHDSELSDSDGDQFKMVKAVSICQAVHSAMKALQEDSPDGLQGYLALNDFILEQIQYAYINNHAKEVSQPDSQCKNLAQAQELLYRIENRILYKMAECKVYSTRRKEVSNEKPMIVHNLQKLIKDDRPRARIAEKSSNQFSAEDIHVEMVKISFGSEDDIDPVKKVLFVPKHDLSKPNPNEFEKASPLVRPEEFTEYQFRVFTKKKGLKKKIVKEAVTSWFSSDRDLELDTTSAKTEFPHEIIGAVECFECGPKGTDIELKKHGIQIHIPDKALDRRIIMEFAVCLDGPFKLPADKRAISPILWICTKENIKRFKKPIEVTIPHIFPELLEHEIAKLQLCFVKADHSTDFCILKDGSKRYSFSTIEGSGSYFRGGSGTLNLDHCCYLCLSANHSAVMTDRAQYCLSQFHLTNGSRNVVIFCATYSLPTCLEAVHSQYLPECAPAHYPPRTFKFQDPIDEQCLVITCESERIKVTANPTNREIHSSEIDFWRRVNNEGANLEFLHKFKMYPPRVIFEVDCTSANVFTLNFKFTGVPESSHLDRQIMFPLSSIPVAP